jgi:hypothetical protein
MAGPPLEVNLGLVEEMILRDMDVPHETMMICSNVSQKKTD